MMDIKYVIDEPNKDQVVRLELRMDGDHAILISNGIRIIQFSPGGTVIALTGADGCGLPVKSNGEVNIL